MPDPFLYKYSVLFETIQLKKSTQFNWLLEFDKNTWYHITVSKKSYETI